MEGGNSCVVPARSSPFWSWVPCLLWSPGPKAFLLRILCLRPVEHLNTKLPLTLGKSALLNFEVYFRQFEDKLIQVMLKEGVLSC